MKLNEIDVNKKLAQCRAIFKPSEANSKNIFVYHPNDANGNPDLRYHPIEDLRGAPQYVRGSFDCSAIRLQSLREGPKRVREFYFANNNFLDSLDGIATEIGFGVELKRNKLTNLHNVHKFIHDADTLDVSGNSLQSNVLGLLLIKNLRIVMLSESSAQHGTLVGVQTIINKHLGSGRDINACQDELIDAGFEQFARL